MILIHPPRVADAIAAIEKMEKSDISSALRRKPGSKGYVPSGAIVRLLRRATAAEDRWSEDVLFRELSRRLQAWARRNYGGIRPEDQSDLAQELCLRVVKEIAKSHGIDFWEITFSRNISRAAADIYQQRFVALNSEDQLEGYTEADEPGDSGEIAESIETKVLIFKRAQEVLTPKEFALFSRMYVTGLPVKSSKGSSDLTRETGIPEGTLREMQASILLKMTPSKERS